MVQHQGPGCSISVLADHDPHYPFLLAAHTDECGGEQVALANARLVARSPELLDALEAVTDVAGRVLSDHKRGQVSDTNWQLLAGATEYGNRILWRVWDAEKGAKARGEHD